jgi:hypothetical protein
VTPNLDELFKILEANWELRDQKYELRVNLSNRKSYFCVLN